MSTHVPEPQPIEIAMCWDGQTTDAELHIDGAIFVGAPKTVEETFHALNDLRDQRDTLLSWRERLFNTFDRFLKENSLWPR